MKMPAWILEQLRAENPRHFPLPLEPLHGWRSSKDERGHTHCSCCSKTIVPGDPVVGCYLEYVSRVFCPERVADNPQLFREWLSTRPGG